MSGVCHGLQNFVINFKIIAFPFITHVQFANVKILLSVVYCIFSSFLFLVCYEYKVFDCFYSLIEPAMVS